ncbi:PstA family ABC transporter permease [Methylohalobius crimeensis]|uniref:PstA family ABC transporter permease n=1 Tax=Methylohalobius crimeensis TaxID=244365 RepID=UPI0003B455FF|nr:ABC transporter permease subunit [Methylohalobius crimeensis]
MSSRIAQALIALLALPALVLPAAILGYILMRGLPGLGRIFSADEAAGFGLGEGLTGQIAGSLLLTTGACLVAAPVALGLAVWLHLRQSDANRPWLTLLHLLQGIPPIVYGLWGLAVFVHLLHWGVSLLAGILILAAVILPMLTLGSLDALARIPPERTEAARALGLSDSAIVARVWLPGAGTGLATGLLLAMARTLSETAPILFTATVFSGIIWPDSWFSPVTTLQTHIFYLAQEGVDPRAIDNAWAAAVVLIGLVLTFSLTALWLRRLGGRK